jgi:hypothetical protein
VSTQDSLIDCKEIKGLPGDVYDSARYATGETMMRKTGLMVLAALLVLTTAGCAPLLVGGAAAVVADEAVEQDNGGDGLF